MEVVRRREHEKIKPQGRVVELGVYVFGIGIEVGMGEGHL